MDQKRDLWIVTLREQTTESVVCSDPCPVKVKGCGGRERNAFTRLGEIRFFWYPHQGPRGDKRGQGGTRRRTGGDKTGQEGTMGGQEGTKRYKRELKESSDIHAWYIYMIYGTREQGT